MKLANKAQFNPVLFVIASLLALVLAGLIYFFLSADAFFRGVSGEVRAKEDARLEAQDGHDISDPFITKAPGWKE